MSEPEAHRLLQQETMFSVIPLRLGVFFLASCTLVTSLIYCIDRYRWHAVFRHFEGGYCPSSWLIVGAIQISGVFAGLAGVLGAWHVKVSYVRAYNIWQYLRLVGVAIVYYIDLPLLRDCEGFVNSVELMAEEHGWNELVYRIALRGRCTSERQLFLVCAFTFLVALMYVSRRTSRYVELINQAPGARAMRNKQLPSGEYRAHAAGERSRLNGMLGVVMRFHPASGRFIVRLNDSDPPADWKKVKAPNLQPEPWFLNIRWNSLSRLRIVTLRLPTLRWRSWHTEL